MATLHKVCRGAVFLSRKEIMCMNRIRMTKTKLDSEMTDTALALDMINELRKCPKPLYLISRKQETSN